eukprot:552982_1
MQKYYHDTYTFNGHWNVFNTQIIMHGTENREHTDDNHKTSYSSQKITSIFKLFEHRKQFKVENVFQDKQCDKYKTEEHKLWDLLGEDGYNEKKRKKAQEIEEKKQKATQEFMKHKTQLIENYFVNIFNTKDDNKSNGSTIYVSGDKKQVLKQKQCQYKQCKKTIANVEFIDCFCGNSFCKQHCKTIEKMYGYGSSKPKKVTVCINCVGAGINKSPKTEEMVYFMGKSSFRLHLQYY